MKEQNNLINSKSKSWIKPIYTLFVVAIPAIMIWIFFSGDFKINNFQLLFWHKILIAIGFVLAIVLLTSLLIYIKLLDVSIMTFSLPVSICFMIIFLTNGLEAWARALIIIPFVFLFIPINMICNKIEFKKIAKEKAKNEQKIVGYKK